MRNENIKERLKVESIAEVQESATHVVWPRKAARPRLCRKKDWIWYHPGEESDEQRWMDCVNRYMRDRNDERRGP